MNILARIAAKQAHLTGRQAGRKAFSQPPFWSMPEWSAFGGGWSSPDREQIEHDYLGYVRGAYKTNGIIFSCIAARQAIFSQVRFGWREFRKFKPGGLFGNTELSLLEKPWLNATTIDLLTRMEVVASLGGNYYATKCDDNGKLGKAATGPGQRIVHMRPDWVTLVIASPSDDPWDIRAKVAGIMFAPMGNFGGSGRPAGAVLLMPDEVCHFAPYPDPEMRFRGMSWLTPIIREIQADKAATGHKERFFANGARLSTVVKFDKDLGVEAMDAFKERFNAGHKGEENAYATLFLGGGADVHVISADMQQLDFKNLSGAGEPLALDTPVPTPSGWTTMGDITSGDQVIGRNGLPANVVGVSPVHIGRNCYRVTLKDRTSIVADAEHLWVAVDRATGARAEKIYTTRMMYDLLQERRYRDSTGGHRFCLPASPIIDLTSADLLVDPYVLGVWLGDGQTAGAAICGDTEDLKFIAAEVESRGYSVVWRKTSPDKVDVFGLPGGLLAALRALGVLGDKHIPQEYLRASALQRLDLLRGLMDTDGTVEASGKGTCQYASKEESLARQFAELVRSLGYRATVSWSNEPRSRTGRSWKVFFRVAQDRIPFLLPRKVDRCVLAGDPFYGDQRSIISIEPVESVPVRCIAVDTEDHLFLAGEGFVPTHNTRIAAAAGIHPTIAGFSEGLQGSSLNAGNFSAARRLVADKTMRHLWGVASSSLQTLLTPPSDTAALWYETRDVAFLREDTKDAADIALKQAQVIRQLGDGGWEPESIKAAMLNEDWGLLKHTGLPSVQVQQTGRAVANGNGAKPLEAVPARGMPALPPGED